MFQLLYRDVLLRFLQEDLGVEGDVTTALLETEDRPVSAVVAARQAGVACGLPFVEPLFQLLDPNFRVEQLIEEGASFPTARALLRLSGTPSAMLAGERTALNLLSRLCGIATQTRRCVDLLAGTSTRLLGTRKTLPGLRFFDKYALSVGGADRHRYGLNDAVMIKDNHLALGGGIEEVLGRARSKVGPMLVIELECDTLDQVRQALQIDLELQRVGLKQGAFDVLLLDNMKPSLLAEAVKLVRAHPRLILTEASGGIGEKDLLSVAEAGVDYVSLGALTHTVVPIDLGLDVVAN